jgi:hypothetical protein
MKRWLILIFIGGAVAGAELTPEARFALAYEQEMKGQFDKAISEYREALSMAQGKDVALSSKLLYRVGVCEQRAGRVSEARAAWESLLKVSTPDGLMAPNAREAIKALDREADVFSVVGRVVLPGDGTNSRSGAQKAWVMAGEWGDEPPVMTDTNGRFNVERRSAGQLADGERYVLVYAEHQDLPLAGMAIVSQKAGEKVFAEIALEPTVLVTGRVMDRFGQPVANVRIRVTGIKSEEEMIPLPFDRIMPPVFSDAQGIYVIEGLLPGLLYSVTVERDGYMMVNPIKVKPLPSVGSRMVPPQSVEPVVVYPLGEVSLKGRVVDDMGRGKSVALSVWTPPPVARQIAATNADDNGWFIFRDVRENLVSLRVMADGELAREVVGIKPMGQDLDIVLRKGSLSESVPVARASNGDIRGSAERRGVEHSKPGVTASSEAYAWVKGLRWLRGGRLDGGAIRADDLRGKVVVLRFSSAYMDESLSRQFPDEPRLLNQLQTKFGSGDMACAWILPAQDDSENGRKVALGAGGDYPIAIDSSGAIWKQFGVSAQGGHAVINRQGVLRYLCEAQNVFKAVKACLAE